MAEMTEDAADSGGILVIMWLPGMLAIACVKQFLELDNNKIINSIWETKIEDMDFNEDSGGNNYNNNNKESNESR
ncbi:hypothetical protein CVS40_6872 [Lucilia cuprina]|nr:hypothetical protein CVS40_6872 [Lucilia cuprina]